MTTGSSPMAAADADLVRWRLLGAISWQARFCIECRQRFVSLCSAAIKRLFCFRVSISLLSASQQSQVNPAAQRLTCYTRAGGSDTCGSAGVAAGDARAVAAAAPRPAAGGCAWSTFHRRSATIGRAAGRGAVGGMPGTSLRMITSTLTSDYEAKLHVDHSQNGQRAICREGRAALLLRPSDLQNLF